MIRTLPKSGLRTHVFLTFKVEGYVDQYGSTAPAVVVRNTLQSFFGFCIALGLFQRELKLPKFNDQIPFFVHKKSNETWEIDGKFAADDRTARTLHDLTFVKLKPEYDNNNFKGKLILDRLTKLQNVFQNRTEYERLILAAKWYFDSFARQDEILSFVQTVVVLEVLLGGKADSDEIGLGALLKNRAAYMIAESNSDRDSLMGDIAKIYWLRSNIVHTGRPHFGLSEHALFSKLRDICQRVFRKEIELLTKGDAAAQ